MACIRGISRPGGGDAAETFSCSMARLLWDRNWECDVSVPMTPERLVGIGFRGWVAGYEYQDVSCWEHVWNIYADVLGPPTAKQAVTELSCWVRQLRQISCRRIEVYPLACSGFCRDECIAISVIAAAQHNRCPALRACAYALTEASQIDTMLDEATHFADVLKAAEQELSPGMVCNVAGISKSLVTAQPN